MKIKYNIEMESQRVEMESHLRISLFLLGVVSMSTQVIMIREALAIFHGNELIIGLFLGIWMLLTASGAFLSIPRPPSLHASMLFLLSLLPIATLFLLITLRYALVPSGIMPGPGMTMLVIFLALLPFCLVSGMLFPIQVQHLSALRERNLLYEGYALDSLGSITGGLLFSLVFILVLPPYESLILLSSTSLLIISILSLIGKRIARAILALIFAILVFLMPVVPQLAKYLDQKQFSGQDIIEIKSSPVGMIAVSRMNGQIFIYQNGLPISLGEDAVSREESVHYAMQLHANPEKILMISGAANGCIGEVLKYYQSHLDYVDRDPWLLKVVEKYNPLPQDPRVNYFFEDARIILNKTDKKYDVILVNIAEPESAEMNRYYTVEFYSLLKSRLNPGGIISASTPSAGNYMSETSREVHSVIFNTLRTVFTHVRIIPGAKDYFIASDTTIEQSIFKNYLNRGIETSYVNPYYINENLVKMRSDLILKEIQPNTQINSDLKPYVFSLFLKQWLERFKINTWLIPLILILLLIMCLTFLGPLNLGLFTGGFTASGLEFILLIWFQVIYGNVYQMTGVIFAVFMMGIAASALLSGKIFKTSSFKGFLRIQASIALFSALASIIILLFSSSPLHLFSSSTSLIIILFLVLITGSLMGFQFALSARLRTTPVLSSAGESFSADLLGSAVGVILVSIYISPQIGLQMTALSLAGLNLVILGVMAMKEK